MLSPAHHLDDATVGTTAARAGARVDGTVVVCAPMAVAPCYLQRGTRPASAQLLIDASERSMTSKAKVRAAVPHVDATPWLMGTFGTIHPTWRLRLHAP
jgi:hypothetical protein